MPSLPQAFTHLGSLPVTEFLQEYWQQKVLFVPQAFTDFKSPINGHDLAGLAMEDLASRIVIQHGDKNQTSWEVKHGPFSEDFFATLPPSHWSLLVQGVDGWVPEIRQLQYYFHFIPSWRFDDVMVSYATRHGGVGPHFDYYDVFLLQAAGKRHWRVGQTCQANEALKPECDMKILENFHTQAEWECEAGDLLYIPPGIAHWGSAMDDDCLTLSIGFRAPSYADILLEFTQDIAADLSEDQRLRDPKLQPQLFPSEISPATISEIQRILQEKISDTHLIKQWFGRYITETKYPSLDKHMLDAYAATTHWVLSTNARAAFSRIDDNYAQVFINGESWHCSTLLAESLCSFISLSISDYSLELDQQILAQLVELHWLIPCD